MNIVNVVSHVDIFLMNMSRNCKLLVVKKMIDLKEIPNAQTFAINIFHVELVGRTNEQTHKLIKHQIPNPIEANS